MVNNNIVTKQPVEDEKAIVINQIVVRNIDRTMKGITTWRNAHIAAERVIYPIRQKLYDLYSDVELDGHLSGLIEKRFGAVLNKKLFFRNTAGEKVESFDALIKSKSFRKFRREVLNTINWGISGAEFIPGKEFEWLPIPRKHIKPELKIIAIEQTGWEGIDYDKMPNLMIMGETHDLGLFLKCAPYAIWKRGGLADYAQFVEIFGQPVRIYEYDAYDIKTKQEVETIAEAAGAAMSLIIPKQANFKMEDGKTANANGDLQSKFVKVLNDEMSVIMLGNTETTTSSQSSGHAQSKIHSKQQMEITKADMEYELQYLNSPQFLSILKSYGFAEAGEFAHEQEADVVMLADRITIDAALSMIIPINDDYFYDTYNIPKPDNYDELKAKLEESKKQKNLPPVEPPGKPKKDKTDPNAEDLFADDIELGRWDKFKLMMADFFAPAPRD